MSVVTVTVTIPAGSATTQLFEPLAAAAQLSVVQLDNGAFFSDTAGITPPYGPDPMPDNLVPMFVTGPPLQINLGVGDTIYVAPYPNSADLHVSYVLTS
jgi:hypothetical protein